MDGFGHGHHTIHLVERIYGAVVHLGVTSASVPNFIINLDIAGHRSVE